jgi:isocitrate dehydrogenase
VATMSDGDFRSTERSVTIEREDVLRIEHDGTVLKDDLKVLPGEIVDAAVMRRRALDEFLAEQIADAKRQGVLFSLHLKATMMKVSDPIIFGHAVRAYFAGVFEQYGDRLPSPNNGLAAMLNAVPEIEGAVKEALANGPALAMVDSDRGITNLHVPSDVIIDASMPAMIRASGQMWNAEGAQQDTKAVIPDSSYAALYAETIDFCREHGAFDPATMGTTPNVGLMAQ